MRSGYPAMQFKAYQKRFRVSQRACLHGTAWSSVAILKLPRSLTSSMETFTASGPLLTCRLFPRTGLQNEWNWLSRGDRAIYYKCRDYSKYPKELPFVVSVLTLMAKRLQAQYLHALRWQSQSKFRSHD